MNLTTGSGSGGHATGDVIVAIENVRGSYFGDTLTGDGANNRIEGSGGADTIFGGDGNDKIYGGNGFDFLTGDGGADKFGYDETNWGLDHITDFTDGVDRIDLRGTGLVFADLTIGYNGGSAKVKHTAAGETNVIILDGVDSALVDATDFMF